MLVRAGYWLNPQKAFCPTTVVIVVNGDCNAKCKMCDFGTRPQNSFSYNYIRDKSPMELSLLKKIIEQIPLRKTDLWFMATEPLLYKDLPLAISYATKRGIRTHVTTNGLLLEDMARALVDSGIYRINVSIDGPARINDFVRGVPGGFDAALKGIEKVLQIKRQENKRFPTVGVNCCMSEYNAGHLIELIENLKGVDIDYLHFNHLQFITQEMASRQNLQTKGFDFTALGVSQTDPRRLDTNKLKEQINRINKIYKDARIDFLPKINSRDIDRFYSQPERFIRGFHRCYYPWRFLHVLPNGDVIVAYRCFSGSMGNLKDNKLSEIWNGERFRGFRRFIRASGGALGVCSRCSAVFCSYYL
jgi:MoaA/NifB/PqqE/SkfB family radical SAM enzyme